MNRTFKNEMQNSLERLVLSLICIGTVIHAVSFMAHGQQNSNAADEPRSGTISGKVVNDSGQPMIGAVVFVRSAGDGAFNRSAIANLEGKFEVSGLDNGIYYVSANSPAFVTLPIDVDSPAPTYRVGDTVNLELIRGGVITGTVTNSAGEPVVGVRVRAFMVKDATGKRARSVAFSSGERTTDDRGIYRIYGLSPGTYLVQSGGGGLQMSMNATDFDAPTFAPSSTRDSATEIQVRSGEETSVDIRYRSEPGHSISGTVKLQGTNGANVSLSVVGDLVTAVNRTYQQANAHGFTLSGIADGEYELTAQEAVGVPTGPFPEIALTDPLRVMVKGSDVTGLELIPKLQASISGKISLESSKIPECQNKRKPLFSETMIAIMQNRKEAKVDDVALARLYLGGSIPDKDGAFVLRNLRPGQYSFNPRYFARYWYLKSISISSGGTSLPAKSPATSTTSKDAARNWTALKTGDRLNGLTITLTEGAASIRGLINKPPEAKAETPSRIYLVPAERERADDPLRYFTSEVVSDGSFSFGNLPPGKYWTLAQPTLEENPNSTEKLRLPDAAEARARLRRSAELLKSEVELKPCQNLTDVKLPPN